MGVRLRCRNADRDLARLVGRCVYALCMLVDMRLTVLEATHATRIW